MQKRVEPELRYTNRVRHTAYIKEMELRCRTSLLWRMTWQLDLLAVELASSVDVRKHKMYCIRQSGSPSTCTCGTRVRDLHSVPYDAGLEVAEMVNRGVCDNQKTW